MIIEDQVIKDCIKKAGIFLDKNLQSDGSFLSLSSPDPSHFAGSLTFHSVFSTALILLCISEVDETVEIRKIKAKIFKFLLSQKGPYYSFNYWVRGSKEYTQIPYPDDLDDTFCALSALFKYNSNVLSGKAMAQIVKLLTTLEVDEGGPYRTWLVDESAEQVWKDVDLAVNSNIAYFLHLQKITLPNLKKYIDKKVEQNEISSPYYPSIFPLIFFISRFAKGKTAKKLGQILIQSQNADGYWENPLNTSLAVSSLLNLNFTYNKNLYKAVDYLLQNQQNGSWQPYPFYTGVNPKRDISYYAGSSALTTAFCIEALAKFLKLSEFKKKTIKKTPDSTQISKQILTQVESRFSLLGVELKSLGLEYLKKMKQIDKNVQILLLPFLFAKSLKIKTPLPSDLLVKLGEANLYGWLAYTIYDDFFDDEGDPKKLSIANVSLRQLTGIYQTLLPISSGFVKIFDELMDQIDSANMWELKNCRIPVENNHLLLNGFNFFDFDYRYLAHRSIGHGLGPLAILVSLGFTPQSQQVKLLIQFFHHYLIAKQLNDDAHDWESDLKNGHLTPVVTKIFQKLPKLTTSSTLNIRSNLKSFQQIFWYEAIGEICRDILFHVKKSRQTLEQLDIIKDPAIFDLLLNPIENSAKLALKEQTDTLQLIKSF